MRSAKAEEFRANFEAGEVINYKLHIVW